MVVVKKISATRFLPPFSPRLHILQFAIEIFRQSESFLYLYFKNTVEKNLHKKYFISVNKTFLSPITSFSTKENNTTHALLRNILG